MRIVVAAIGISIAGASLPALAQEAKDVAKEVRIVGCVQWEKEYRQQLHTGRGGALGTGINNEFVLTMVKPEGSRRATAYSITGDREKELGRRIGQQIEVIGIIEDEGRVENDRVGDLPRIRMTGWVPVKDSCTQAWNFSASPTAS